MTARVLVVDDIETNRRLLQVKLETRYYSVFTASSGAEALASAEAHTPDIILLDVMMPEMDGYEVCRHLKSNPATQHIPVVMLTALTAREDRLRGLEAGAEDFLSKPIEDFALFARLEALTRYNTVAHELQARGDGETQSSQFSEFEVELLSRPSNILVIDQDKHAGGRLAASLQKMGHSAYALDDAGTRGVKFQTLDIVILALSDQKQDPLKLCAQLKTMREARDFSIIVSCRREDQEMALSALRIGASDIIYAPLEMLELQARISTQSRRKRYIEILRRRVDRGLELSIIDPLTGLYNRRYMLERLQLWMRRATNHDRTVSIVAFDIDHFKRINDLHGHQAGDDVLKGFSERLRTNIRPKDIACRPGGEEFLLIMPETTREAAARGAERIRQAIAAQPFYSERAQTDIAVTVSAGVAMQIGPEDLMADLLHRADKALYQAKLNGRNRIEARAA
jgi:two-component system cell cycle response regulator